MSDFRGMTWKQLRALAATVETGSVSGAAKADAVAAAIGGASPDDVPAAGAVGWQETIWLLDSAAAGALSH